MFIQIHIFTNTIKEMELKQKFDLSIKYYHTSIILWMI